MTAPRPARPRSAPQIQNNFLHSRRHPAALIVKMKVMNVL